MDQLARIKDSLFGFFSPTRNAMPDPKRRRTIGNTTPSKYLAAEHAYEPISEPRGEKAQLALYSRLGAKYLSSSLSKNPLKRSREEEQDDEDEVLEEGEADEEMKASDSEEGCDSLHPEDSPSQVSPRDDDEDGGEVDEDEDGDGLEDEDQHYEDEDEDEVENTVDEETSSREKVEEYLARQAELVLKKDAISEVKQQGTWHPDEVYLFERLSLRSYEPLIPQDWQIDFGTLPGDLFDLDKDKVLINHNCTRSSSGIKALQGLLSLGTRVKDMCDEATATRCILRSVNSYIRWTEMDGGYFKKRFFPVLTVVTGKPKQSTDRISKAITDQMQLAAKQYRDYLRLPETYVNELGEVEMYRRQPPLLYGIIIAQSITIYVTLDSSKPEATLRHIAHFDFKEGKMAVWNGFALAIICCVARNYLMSIKDEMEDEDPDSDPDA